MGKQLLWLGQVVAFWVLVFSYSTVSGQESMAAVISGTVTSTSGERLPGVTLIVSGLNWGTVTDAQGAFEFKDVPGGTYGLQASSMGYETIRKSLEVSERIVKLDLVLRETSYTMDDVVVKGKSATRLVTEQAYQVSSVSAKDLFNSTADAKAVMNRISGVRIREEGGLGSNMDFTLNGFSGEQVKFFMDGIPMDNFGASLGLSDLP